MFLRHESPSIILEKPAKAATKKLTNKANVDFITSIHFQSNPTKMSSPSPSSSSMNHRPQFMANSTMMCNDQTPTASNTTMATMSLPVDRMESPSTITTMTPQEIMEKNILAAICADGGALNAPILPSESLPAFAQVQNSLHSMPPQSTDKALSSCNGSLHRTIPHSTIVPMNTASHNGTNAAADIAKKSKATTTGKRPSKRKIYRKKKDKEAPKRPRTAFQFFSSDQYKSTREEVLEMDRKTSMVGIGNTNDDDDEDNTSTTVVEDILAENDNTITTSATAEPAVADANGTVESNIERNNSNKEEENKETKDSNRGKNQGSACPPNNDNHDEKKKMQNHLPAIMKIIANKWNNIDVRAKEQYEFRAALDKERFHVETKAYEENKRIVTDATNARMIQMQTEALSMDVFRYQQQLKEDRSLSPSTTSMLVTRTCSPNHHNNNDMSLSDMQAQAQQQFLVNSNNWMASYMQYQQQEQPQQYSLQQSHNFHRRPFNKENHHNKSCDSSTKSLQRPLAQHNYASTPIQYAATAGTQNSMPFPGSQRNNTSSYSHPQYNNVLMPKTNISQNHQDQQKQQGLMKPTHSTTCTAHVLPVPHYNATKPLLPYPDPISTNHRRRRQDINNWNVNHCEQSTNTTAVAPPLNQTTASVTPEYSTPTTS